DAGAHAQDVGVIVPARHARAQGLAADHRAHAPVAVGADGHAHAGAAHQDAQRDFPRLDAARKRVSEVRVIAGLGAVRAEVLKLEAAPFELCRKRALELDAGVITGYPNALLRHVRPQCLAKINEALVPPKPNEFDSTYLRARLRDSCGTRSNPSVSGSG